jgi:hypothetical protein
MVEAPVFLARNSVFLVTLPLIVARPWLVALALYLRTVDNLCITIKKVDI